jgi:hypothetical protein
VDLLRWLCATPTPLQVGVLGACSLPALQLCSCLLLFAFGLRLSEGYHAGRFTESQWILPCQIDRTHSARSITVISMGSVLLPADRSSKAVLECRLDRALC